MVFFEKRKMTHSDYPTQKYKATDHNEAPVSSRKLAPKLFLLTTERVRTSNAARIVTRNAPLTYIIWHRREHTSRPVASHNWTSVLHPQRKLICNAFEKTPQC